MSFANPKAFLFLFATLAFFCVTHFLALRRQTKLSLWINRSLWSEVIPEFKRSVFLRKFVFLCLALSFLLLSMARPQWGEKEELIQSQGMDILFLLDLSNSMLAEDTPPSRLNRAQTLIKKTLEGLGDDRVGIVGFAGKAFLTVPLTTDFGYVAEMADTLDPSAMVSQGTDVGQAIEVGMRAFERGAEDDHKTSRAIVLISDGEDFGEEAKASANKLRDFGAGFFAISVGTKEGAPIPLRNDSGVLQTYKKDRHEKPILTRVNREFMAKLAEDAGGTYLELVNPDDASYTLTKALRSLQRGSTKDQRQVTKIDRFQYFLAVSILFFLLHLFTGYRPIRKPFLVMLCVILPSLSHAQSLGSYLKSKGAEKNFQKNDFEGSSALYGEAKKLDPENPTLQFNEATALAKGKKTEEALNQFNQATKQSLSEGDYEIAARSLYNEGVTHSEQKNFHDSYDRLTKAIELARISNQPEIEKKAREALVSVTEKQKQQQKENQEQNKQDQGKQGQEKPDQKKNDPSSGEQKKDQGQTPPRPEEGKRREFKSGTLSKDVAESIMNDLSDKEKQLYQHRLKERKAKEVENDKDW